MILHLYIFETVVSESRRSAMMCSKWLALKVATKCVYAAKGAENEETGRNLNDSLYSELVK